MIDAAARRRHLRHAVAPARWRHGRAAAPGTVCRRGTDGSQLSLGSP